MINYLISKTPLIINETKNKTIKQIMGLSTTAQSSLLLFNKAFFGVQVPETKKRLMCHDSILERIVRPISWRQSERSGSGRSSF